MKMSIRHARMSVRSHHLMPNEDPPPHPPPSTHNNLKYVHHLHHVRMTSWSAPRVRPVPKCFIMSLRDPAARLKSGFAFVERRGWGAGLNKQVALPSRAARTYRGFVAAMRDPKNADHRFAMGLYWSSVSKPAQTEPLVYDSVLGGHNFLVSQLDYLHGWKEHCRSGELHFMCAPR